MKTTLFCYGKKQIVQATMVLLLVLTVLTGCGGTAPQEKPSAESGASVHKVEPSVTETLEPGEVTGEDRAGDDAEALTNDINAAISAYAAFLEEQMLGKDLDLGACPTAALVHVDDDEIPELALITGDSHADYVLFYSYDGEIIKELGSYGAFGTALYERNKGTLFGYWTGQGSTFYSMGTVADGTIVEEQWLSITDLCWSPPSDEEELPQNLFEFRAGEGFENSVEISQEEFEAALEPYLPENREYLVINCESYSTFWEADNLEEYLLNSLMMEEEYPKIDTLSGSVITPFNEFETNALKKVQGVWTSVGHSGSISWVVKGRWINRYEAIWKEDEPVGSYGVAGEYELRDKLRIESIEKETGDRGGDFLLRPENQDGYYIYVEYEHEILLENYWDPDGYSGSSSMYKNDQIPVEVFSNSDM